MSRRHWCLGDCTICTQTQTRAHKHTAAHCRPVTALDQEFKGKCSCTWIYMFIDTMQHVCTCLCPRITLWNRHAYLSTSLHTYSQTDRYTPASVHCLMSSVSDCLCWGSGNTRSLPVQLKHSTHDRRGSPSCVNVPSFMASRDRTTLE